MVCIDNDSSMTFLIYEWLFCSGLSLLYDIVLIFKGGFSGLVKYTFAVDIDAPLFLFSHS